MEKTIFKIEIIAKKSNLTNLIDAIKLANDFFSENEDASLNLSARAMNKLESSYNVSFKKNKKGEHNKIILQETSRFEIDSSDKDLQEIQIEIKKELGGASLNHFINYFTLLRKKSIFDGFKVDMLWDNFRNDKNNVLVIIGVFPLYRSKDKPEVSFCDSYTLVDADNRSLNIFSQSEDFQRKLYDAIQIIKNINN